MTKENASSETDADTATPPMSVEMTRDLIKKTVVAGALLVHSAERGKTPALFRSAGNSVTRASANSETDANSTTELTTRAILIPARVRSPCFLFLATPFAVSLLFFTSFFPCRQRTLLQLARQRRVQFRGYVQIHPRHRCCSG